MYLVALRLLLKKEGNNSYLADRSRMLAVACRPLDLKGGVSESRGRSWTSIGACDNISTTGPLPMNNPSCGQSSLMLVHQASRKPLLRLLKQDVCSTESFQHSLLSPVCSDPEARLVSIECARPSSTCLKSPSQPMHDCPLLHPWMCVDMSFATA